MVLKHKIFKITITLIIIISYLVILIRYNLDSYFLLSKLGYNSKINQQLYNLFPFTQNSNTSISQVSQFIIFLSFLNVPFYELTVDMHFLFNYASDGALNE